MRLSELDGSLVQKGSDVRVASMLLHVGLCMYADVVCITVACMYLTSALHKCIGTTAHVGDIVVVKLSLV